MQFLCNSEGTDLPICSILFPSSTAVEGQWDYDLLCTDTRSRLKYAYLTYSITFFVLFACSVGSQSQKRVPGIVKFTEMLSHMEKLPQILILDLLLTCVGLEGSIRVLKIVLSSQRPSETHSECLSRHSTSKWQKRREKKLTRWWVICAGQPLPLVGISLAQSLHSKSLA